MATQTALIVGGALKVSPVMATPSYLDVSGEISSCTLHATVDTVEIPATMGFPKGNRAGAASYSIEMHYLSTPGTNGVLLPLLLGAIGSSSGGLMFTVNLTTGANSATNPQYSGTFVVTAADFGGDVGTLSAGSTTFPLFTAWTVATV